MASIDTHLKLDGVDGESTHKDHQGEIELLSWNWNVFNDAKGFGGGSGKGKAEPGDFVFTHLYDKGSPTIAKYCASGKHFADATLTARKAGEGQKDFLTVKFKEVFIKSVVPTGNKGGDIVEQVTLNYKQIDFAYKPQDEKGTLGGEVKFGWNNATTEIT
jgi:type VI secretion system secreted protein Hcp